MVYYVFPFFDAARKFWQGYESTLYEYILLYTHILQKYEKGTYK